MITATWCGLSSCKIPSVVWYYQYQTRGWPCIGVGWSKGSAERKVGVHLLCPPLDQEDLRLSPLYSYYQRPQDEKTANYKVHRHQPCYRGWEERSPYRDIFVACRYYDIFIGHVQYEKLKRLGEAVKAARQAPSLGEDIGFVGSSYVKALLER